MNFRSRINTGDRIGSQLKGPEWTPYAQAIAENYPIQVPWFYTLPSNLVEGVTFHDRKTVVTSPQQHDVLIFGAYAIVRSNAGSDEGIFILLQITHEETGIPWAVPNSIGAALLPAIAGTVNPIVFPTGPNRTTVQRLPEAFFLPKHNRLRLDWTQGVIDFGANLDALITFVGVQLIGGHPPSEITMPDGTITKVGSRLPWFITLVFGNPTPFRQGTDWILTPNQESLQFTAPQNCDVEIHDVYYNRRLNVTSDTLVTKLTEMGGRGIWTPQETPIFAWTGDEQKVNPSMPFAKPFLLEAGHKLAVNEFFSTPAVNEVFAALTFRGVRLCKF